LGFESADLIPADRKIAQGLRCVAKNGAELFGQREAFAVGVERLRQIPRFAFDIAEFAEADFDLVLTRLKPRACWPSGLPLRGSGAL
jgi:hypothetical protein